MVQLEHQQLEAASAQCPVCGNTNQPTEANGYATVLTIQQQPKVALMACPQCHAMSADRLPTSDYLISLYDPAVYSSSLTADTGLTQRCAKRMLHRFDFSPNTTGRTHWHVVDYGGGNGQLGRTVCQMIQQKHPGATAECTVVDVYDQVSGQEGMAFCSVDNFLAGHLPAYDLMIASAVLEHIPTLTPVLNQMMASASPNAYLYGRTPYEAPLAKVLPGYTIRWPRHVHDMGPEFWEGLPKRFAGQCRMLTSQPSLVETSMVQQPVRTLAAYALKFPAVIESKIRQAFNLPTCLWRLVGGWEAYLIVNPAAPSAGIQ